MGRKSMLVTTHGACSDDALIVTNPRTIRFCHNFHLDSTFAAPDGYGRNQGFHRILIPQVNILPMCSLRNPYDEVQSGETLVHSLLPLERRWGSPRWRADE